MSKTIDINLEVISKIAESCSNGSVDGVEAKIDEMQEEIKSILELIDEVGGLTYRRMGKYLEDITDEVRGIENNVHDLGKGAKKYYDRMSDIDSLLNESANVFVSEEISNVQSHYKHNGGVNTNIKNIKSPLKGITDLSISEVNQVELNNLNATIQQSVDSIDRVLNSMLDTVDDTNKNLKIVEDFKKKDYYESVHIAAAVGVAIALTIVAAPLEAVVLGAEASAFALLLFDAGFAAVTTTIKSTATNHYNGSDWGEATISGVSDGIEAGKDTFSVLAIVGVAFSSIKSPDVSLDASASDINKKGDTSFKAELDSKEPTKSTNIDKSTSNESIEDIKGSGNVKARKNIDWSGKVYGDDFTMDASKEGLSAAKEELLDGLKYSTSDDLGIDEDDVTVQQELEELISMVENLKG